MSLADQVRELITVNVEYFSDEWVTEGDTIGQTAQEIACDWDKAESSPRPGSRKWVFVSSERVNVIAFDYVGDNDWPSWYYSSCIKGENAKRFIKERNLSASNKTFFIR